jgi:hypothetical protein
LDMPNVAFDFFGCRANELDSDQFIRHGASSVASALQFMFGALRELSFDLCDPPRPGAFITLKNAP